MSGSAFGEYGEGYLRFSYASTYEKIEEALGRIEEAVKEFKHPVLPLPEDCSVLSCSPCSFNRVQAAGVLHSLISRTGLSRYPFRAPQFEHSGAF